MPAKNAPAFPVWIGELAESPLGVIWTAVSPLGAVAISLWGDRDQFVRNIQKQTGQEPVYDAGRTAVLVQELDDYLTQKRQTFATPIHWQVMTDFQQKALHLVYEIPYGQTCTYNDIAHKLGNPKTIRAVGRANATNPLPILVPCHRVLGSDGNLHGYSAPGGLETKAWLLRLEGSWLI